MFLLPVLLIYSNCASSNCSSMVDGFYDYFSYAEPRILPNMRCIVALILIWLSCLLLRDCNFVECRYDEDLILYDRHEFWVELVMRHVKFLCWECLYGCRKDLGLQIRYLCWRLCGVWKTIIPHDWNLPEGHIITGVGRWGQQPEGSERWMW